MGLQANGTEFSSIFEPVSGVNNLSISNIKEGSTNISSVYFGKKSSSGTDKTNGISSYWQYTNTGIKYGITDIANYLVKKYFVCYGNGTAAPSFTATPNQTFTASNSSYNVGNHAYLLYYMIGGGNNGSSGGSVNNSQNSGNGGSGGSAGQELFGFIEVVPNSTMNITIGSAGQNCSFIYQHPVNGATTVTCTAGGGRAGGATSLGGIANGTAPTLTRNPANGNVGTGSTSINNLCYSYTVTRSTITASSSVASAGTTNDADNSAYYLLYAGGAGGSNGGCGINNGAGQGGTGGNGKSPSVEGSAGNPGANASTNSYGSGGGGGGGAGGAAVSRSGGSGGSGYQGILHLFY